MSGPLFTRTNASQRPFAVKGTTGYLREVAGRVAPPAVPRRRHSDPQAVTHESVADVLSRIFGNVSQFLPKGLVNSHFQVISHPEKIYSFSTMASMAQVIVEQRHEPIAKTTLLRRLPEVGVHALHVLLGDGDAARHGRPVRLHQDPPAQVGARPTLRVLDHLKRRKWKLETKM